MYLFYFFFLPQKDKETPRHKTAPFATDPDEGRESSAKLNPTRTAAEQSIVCKRVVFTHTQSGVKPDCP